MPKVRYVVQKHPLAVFHRFEVVPRMREAMCGEHYGMRDGIKLFGGDACGPDAGQLKLPHMISHDETAIITNWRATTNIDPALEAFREWAHVTTATFTIGMFPYRSLSIADLIARREGQAFEERPRISPDESDVVGRALYEAASGLGVEDYETLTDEVRERWKLLAVVADRHLRPPMVHIIPVRQCFDVRVYSDHYAFSRLLESIPATLGPVRVAIHLEGFTQRDVG